MRNSYIIQQRIEELNIIFFLERVYIVEYIHVTRNGLSKIEHLELKMKFRNSKNSYPTATLHYSTITPGNYFLGLIRCPRLCSLPTLKKYAQGSLQAATPKLLGKCGIHFLFSVRFRFCWALEDLEVSAKEC